MSTIVTERVITPSMSSQVNIALDQLDKHQLVEAERSLLKILSDIQPETKDRDQHIIKSMVGLGDISFKRSRHARGNVLEWHWRCLQALGFYHSSLRHCEQKIHSGTFENKLHHWLQEEQSKIKLHFDKVEQMVLKSVQKHLLGISSETKHVRNMALDRVIDLSWLDMLQKYCKDRQRHQADNLAENSNDTESEKDSIEEIKEKEDKMEKDAKPESDTKSKINFGKIQKAVQKLARQISHEVRYRQKMGLSPHNLEHTIDINKIQEDSDEEEEVFPEATMPETTKSSSPKRDTKSERSSPKRSKSGVEPEYNWQEDRFDSTVKYTVRGERETLPFEPEKSARMPITGEPLLVNKRKRSVEDRLPVVLTIWEAYRQPLPSTNMTLPISQHRQETFEELSPVAEVVRLPSPQWRTAEFPAYSEPITEESVIFALSRILIKMTHQWREDKRIKAANEVLKYAVGVLKHVPPQEYPDKYLAEALTLLGSMKCKLGDIIGGTQLMEKAIKIYEDSGEVEAIYHIANVWFEMGDVFIAGQMDDGALYDLIMKSVREGLENEDGGELHIPDSDSDSSDDEDDSKTEQNYYVGVQEAVDCYTEAISILKQIPKGNNQNQLYAEVQTKLGDCSIMVGNYDKAVECYEEAMRVCKHSVGSDSLPNNAHALLMMGMTNYVLGNYPKAVRMFETAHLIQQHLHGTDTKSFGMAFNFTMMGISNYLMKQHHKCIVWCLKAFEMYTNIYRHNLAKAEEQKVWFIANTLYYLGYSYNMINMHDKALYYLEMSQYLLMKADEKCVKQLVKTLKVMADVYSTTDEHDKALSLYNEAYDYSMSIGDESSGIALQNQLLNRIAGVHVTTKQYGDAAVYLEQALDHQKNVESGIKGDLITIMFQLGVTYMLAGDLDRAIDCFTECLESYQEIDGSPDGGMSQTLCNLATLNHVKSCMQDEQEDILHFENLCEHYFEEAYKLEPEGSIGAKYANYLYQQGMYADALEVLLPMLRKSFHADINTVCYRGVEQAILPEQLQLEVDDMDEAVLNLKIFCNFIAVLCFRQLRLNKDADDCMMLMFDLVMTSQTTLNLSMLAYAMMEMDLYPEAAQAFYDVACISEDQSLAMTNMRLCCMTWVYVVYMKAVVSWYDYCQSFVTKENLRKVEEADREKRKVEMSNVKERKVITRQKSPVRKAIRDSGYYGTRVESIMEKYKRDLKTGLEHTEHAQTRKSWSGSELSDGGYKSTDTLASSESKDELFRDLEEQGTPRDVIKSALNRHKKDMVAMRASESTEDLHRFASVSTLVDRSFESQQNLNDEETWQTFEETVETPNAILQSESLRDLRPVGSGEEWRDKESFMSESQSMKELRYTHMEAPHLDTTDETEEWITEEETVETPAAILTSMNSSNESQTSVIEKPVSPTRYRPHTRPQDFLSTQSLPTSPDYNLNMDKSSYEEAVTPTNDPGFEPPSQYVKSPSHISVTSYYAEPESHEHNTYSKSPVKETKYQSYSQIYTSTPKKQEESPTESWKTEETVDTPIELLEILSKQGLRAAEEAYSALAPEEQQKIMNSVSDVDETWTTEEEVVETPLAVLEHVRKSSSGTERTESESSYSNQGYYGYKQSSLSSQTHDSERTSTSEAPQSDNYSYSRYSSYGRRDRIQSPTEEQSWTTTEETVTTPSEIIDMIKNKSATDNSSSRFQYGTDSYSSVNRYGYSDNRRYGNSWEPTVESMNQTNRRHLERGDSADIWESSEETVETPAAILQALRAAQH